MKITLKELRFFLSVGIVTSRDLGEHFKYMRGDR